MSWRTFQAWQRLSYRRSIERINNAKRKAAGMPPAQRPRLNTERGPQEPPPEIG